MMDHPPAVPSPIARMMRYRDLLELMMVHVREYRWPSDRLREECEAELRHQPTNPTSSTLMSR